MASGFETMGTAGALGRKHLRQVALDYVRPVEWLVMENEGCRPKFKDHVI